MGAARARYWASVPRVDYPHLMPGASCPVPLNPKSHPAQDHDRDARAHPDGYLRHRVEIQVKWEITDS